MRVVRNEKTYPLVWDLSPLKRNLNETKKQVLAFTDKWKNRSDYLESPQILLQALDEYDTLMKMYGLTGDEGQLMHLRSAQDQNNPEIKAQLNKIEDAARILLNEIQFFDLSLGKIPVSTQVLFLADPALADYRHFLEKIFAQAKYMLSESEEKILTLKEGAAHSSWIRMTSSLLAKEMRRGKNLSLLIAELSDPKKTVRDAAAQDVLSILQTHADVAENEMNAILGNKKIDDELRNLPRPDAGRHLADDIDSAVVDAMTQAVAERFDIASRFYRLKARMMKVEKLKYWERNVPVGKLVQKYTYAQSVDLVDRVFTNLDPQFGSILRSFAENGQIDVYPHVGKSGGAFCSSDLPTQPVYILLNHTDQLHDVLTLAHEAGHGINDELMKTQTRAVNYGSPLSIAEVASTFMEDFVLQDLLAKAPPKQRLALYMQKLNDDISTIFRQVAGYNFEKELHREFREQGYLAKEQIGKLFQKHMESYMGSSVEQTPDHAQTYWVYWSHFRRFFYVYSYASGLLISKSLQAQVKKNPGFISNVKQILSAGSSDSPQNIFKKYAGIDISDALFWTSGLDEVELLVTQAERLFEEVKD